MAHYDKKIVITRTSEDDSKRFSMSVKINDNTIISSKLTRSELETLQAEIAKELAE